MPAGISRAKPLQRRLKGGGWQDESCPTKDTGGKDRRRYQVVLSQLQDLETPGAD
jgi:hypothetical protein